MSGSTCCFLTCIQVSQEASNLVWYSHLLKNIPVCCDPQRLWHSQWSRSRFFSGILLLFLWSNGCWQFDLWSGSFAFSKSGLNIWCKALLSQLCWVNLSPWHHIWLHLSFVLLRISQKPDTFSRGEIQKLLESDSRGQTVFSDYYILAI